MKRVQPNRGWRGAVGASVALATALFASTTLADSVGQVATAKRISRQTVTLLDPQGQPLPDAGAPGNTLAKVGDVLTYVIQFTPVPNGAYRGMGGYITDYIPPNTEVVGARIVDRNGNTVRPHRGGLACDGYGPRGSGNYVLPLVDGSMTQLYADTGIFFSRDGRTVRQSRNPTSGLDEAFLSLKNGVQMPVSPSGAGGLANLLNTTAPYFAHNNWDLAQEVLFFDPGNSPEHVGNAAIGYGSPVAGPQTWYGLEVTIDPPAAAVVTANAKTLGRVGPWERVRTTGSEIGRRGFGTNPPTAAQNMPQCNGSAPTRVGVPAVDVNGVLLGWNLSTSNPLPANANAVRFALGELVVGDEYYAEISLRVKALPLDPVFGDVNCAEVAGGDASSMSETGGSGGKDRLWRYFLPAPACVALNLLFENTVDKVLAVAGAALTNTLEVKNLATTTQTSVTVRDCYVPGEETFVAAGTTAGYTVDTTGAGCPNPAAQDAIVWTVGPLAPGESRTFVVKFTGQQTTSNQAVYSSTAVPLPGFVATAFTTVANVALMRLVLSAAPSYVPALPGTVKYTATFASVGTGAANTVKYDVTLPASWTYKAGTTRVNTVVTALNPTQLGRIVRFTTPLAPAAIAPTATLTLDFDVDVPVGTTGGLYTADLTSWVNSAKLFEDSIFGQAPVAVLSQRSVTPSVGSPILQGATSVTGTSTEATGSTVTVYVNGNPAGTGTVQAGGTFAVAVPALYGGQRVTVTVQAAGELESAASPAESVVGVSGVAACSDGKDNDGDGKTDYPADPGCTSATDADETDVPQCSDGIDNDGDGKIDFPADEGCSSYVDNSESGLPACSDGVDNDGDGKIDFPADPGCASATDVNEADIPACADRIDNDGDGKIDFPADPGCLSSLDDTENDVPTDGLDASVPGGDGGLDATLGGSSMIVQGDATVPDPGGVPDNGAAGSSGGCGCRTATGHENDLERVILICGALSVLVMRRRRTARPTDDG